VFLYLLSFTIAHYRGLSLAIAAQRSEAQRSETQRSAAVVEMPLYSVLPLPNKFGTHSIESERQRYMLLFSNCTISSHNGMILQNLDVVLEKNRQKWFFCPLISFKRHLTKYRAGVFYCRRTYAVRRSFEKIGV